MSRHALSESPLSIHVEGIRKIDSHIESLSRITADLISSSHYQNRSSGGTTLLKSNPI